MSVESQVAAGQTVAGYVVEDLLGRGGMGEVYRARDERLERPVALKLLLRDFAEDAGFREGMLRESRLAASLDHPNVVPIYEAGEADGRLFIAMRFVDGTDLKVLLRREGPLEPGRAVAIAAQVADALDAAHALGLVHRDVKPSNVLLDQQGGREHAYLADFGLTQSASDRQPAEGSLMGSVDYVAPEQVRGDEIDGRADVYALGCLLFEALTGSLPFAGPSEVAVVYSHLQEEPPAASERRPALPPALDEVLERAMAKNPEARQPAATALVAEVASALGLDATAHSRRWLVVLACCLAFAAVAATAAAVVLAGRGGAVAASGGRIVGIDPASNRVFSTYSVSAHPGAITTSAGRVWAGDFRDGSLWRLDPATGDLARFTPTGEPRDFAALGDKVYVASDGETLLDGVVSRYDAITGSREDGVRVTACSVAAGDGVLWVAGCPYLKRVSVGAGRMQILRKRLVPFQTPPTAANTRFAMRDMAIGEGALWVVGDAADRRVFKVDRLSGKILHITSLPFAPRSIAAGEGGIWVTGPIDDVVARLDPTSGAITAITHVPAGAVGVAAGSGGIWVASTLAGSLSRVDPTSARVVKTISVPGEPREVAVGAGGIWVTTDER